jgi:alpha-beta hydrolase superfamily lysophospholipase
MVSFFKKIIYMLILSFLLMFLLTGCTSLIYQPDRYLHGDPHAYGINFKEFYTRSQDGTRLVAWDLKSKKANPENLVLMFHGNAQNLSSHVFNLTWMLDHSSDVLIFDYRGYGLSEGTPYPRGVAEDGVRFLQLAYDKFKKYKYKRLIIYTQSLGGTIAMRSLEEVSWKNEISLLVLDSTFRSPQDVANEKTHHVLGWLISSEQTAQKNLSHLTMPVLVIHAPLDPVIAYKFGEEIFEKIPSKKKTFWKIDGGRHGDVFFVKRGIYREKLMSLIKQVSQ